MRTIFEQQPEVCRIYLGSRRHLMERLFNDENEPFWRSAKKVELGVIEPQKFWRRFIPQRFKQSRKQAGKQVVDELLARTTGHPYATQELCYFLWEQTPFDGAATEAELDRRSAGGAALRGRPLPAALGRGLIGPAAHAPGARRRARPPAHQRLPLPPRAALDGDGAVGAAGAGRARAGHARRGHATTGSRSRSSPSGSGGSIGIRRM